MTAPGGVHIKPRAQGLVHGEPPSALPNSGSTLPAPEATLAPSSSPPLDEQQQRSDTPSPDLHAETQHPATDHAPQPHSTPAVPSTSTSRRTPSDASTSGRPVLLVLLPALAAVAGAAWLWLRSRTTSDSADKPAKPVGKATGKAATKAGSKAGSPATRKGGAARKDHATGKKNATESPLAPEEPPAPPEEPILPDTLQVVVAPLQLLPPPNPPAPYAPLPLLGQSFIVSEDVDVEGHLTTYGIPEWAGHYQEESTPSSSAPSVIRAVSAGATCTAKVAVQRAGLDFVGANFGNVLNKTRVAGGGATGMAVEVFAGRAAFGLAGDWVGEVRIPGACAGLYVYRPTPGPLGGPGASVSAGGSVMSVMARELPLLQKVAQVLGAPGSSNIKGEILQFVVAQDLFDMCAPELQPAVLAVKKAILKWAGSDQAGAVQLVRFLSNHVGSWSALLPGAELAAGYESSETTVSVNEFLEAALVATNIIRAEELHVRAGAVAKAAAAAAAAPAVAAAPAAPPAADNTSVEGGAATSPAGADTGADAEAASTSAPAVAAADASDSGVEQTATATDSSVEQTMTATATVVADVDSTSAPVVAGAEALGMDTVLPPRPSARQLAAARAMADDVADCLKSTVKPDTLMVLPALPFPPPKRTTEPLELLMFAKLTQCFHALATLGNCPTLTAPVGQLRDGSPVAISIMTVQKYDQRLLSVSQRLCPMIHESFEAVKEEITAMAMQRAREEDTPSTTSSSAATSNGHNHSHASKVSQAGPDSRQRSSDGTTSNGPHSQTASATQAPVPSAPVDPKKLDKAEKAKAKGNELYQAGKYAEAMNEYTKAITFNPNSHVYLSNRAMACIKLFRFEQAEEDCNKVLKFELTDKDKVKALLRRATARDALQKYDVAEQDLRAVLRLEPNNKQAREDLRSLRQHQAQMAEAQAAMVQQMRVQQAAAGAAGGLPAGAGLPLGMDPSMFPPGLLEGLAGQGAEYGGFA